MVISHKYKLLFVHIPKTGGGTVYNVLKKMDPRVEIYGSTHIGLGSKTAEKYKKYFKFTLIRNPYTIQVSNYRWRLRGENFPENTPLKEFICQKCDKNVCLHQFRYIMHKERLLVDFVGKYEQMQASMDYVSVATKLPKINLKDFNKAHFYGSYNWRDYYDERTKNLVFKICREDFYKGGYPK